jgi:RNA polymerase sigma-70 factor (ECF subfamily)
MPEPEARLAELIEFQGPFVRSLALRLAPAPGLAEDIAQQVFLELIAKAAQWDLDRDLKPLLATMTRNVALRCWRERTRVMSAEIRGLAEHIRTLAEGSEVTWYRPEEQAALEQCLEQLPEKSRRLIELHYDLGVSSVNIATQMQMTADAVRRALFRLREQLRKCIELAFPKAGK